MKGKNEKNIGKWKEKNEKNIGKCREKTRKNIGKRRKKTRENESKQTYEKERKKRIKEVEHGGNFPWENEGKSAQTGTGKLGRNGG